MENNYWVLNTSKEYLVNHSIILVNEYIVFSTLYEFNNTK